MRALRRMRLEYRVRRIHVPSTRSGIGFWNFTALHGSINTPMSCSTAPRIAFLSGPGQRCTGESGKISRSTEASTSTESFLCNLIRTALIIEAASRSIKYTAGILYADAP